MSSRPQQITQRFKTRFRPGDALASAYYRFLSGRLLDRIEQHRITAHQMSFAGAIAALCVPLGFAVHPCAGLLFLICSAVADSLDGPIARRQGRASAFGAFLDDSLDRVSDFFYLLGFWLLFRPHHLWLPVILLVFAAVMLTHLADYVRARAHGLDRHGGDGFMDRTHRVLYLVIWALLTIVLPGIRLVLAWIGLSGYIALTLATVIQSMLVAKHQFESDVHPISE